MSVAENGTERGFGTGLRAKLQGDVAEPRSPGEAIAASPSPPAILEIGELDQLRAELNASLAREQDLRLSLSDQMETSGRDMQVEQLAEQAGALDRRATALAETEATLGRGVTLLFAYSLGLGVPFVYTGLAFGRMTSVFTWVRRHFRAINVVSGLALTLFGILLLTDNVTWMSRQLIHVFDALHLDALSSS